MALESGFGIELAMLVDVGEDWKHIPLKHDPDLPLKYNLKVQDDGDVRLRLEMETLDSTLIWRKSTGMIICKARSPYDISWAGFLFYVKAMEDFSAKIKEQ